MNCSTARFVVNSFLMVAVLLTFTVAMQGQTTKKKNAPPEKEYLIDIIIYREGLVKTPEPKLSQHKHHDVVVYKAEVDAYYGIARYLIEHDTLHNDWWGLALHKQYDVVYYRWTNDTTVVLRFHNTATKEAKTYSISGTTTHSRMKVLKTD